MQTRLLLCPCVYFGFFIVEIFGISGKLSEFVEGDIEHDFQRVVPVDVNAFCNKRNHNDNIIWPVYTNVLFVSLLEDNTQSGTESLILDTKPNLPTPEPCHLCTPEHYNSSTRCSP